MTLSPDDIQRLLAKPEPKTTAGGKKIDASVRTLDVWFALNHKAFDEDKHEATRCSNPECDNPVRMCVALGNPPQWTCRICFLNGYLLETHVK